MTTNFGVGDNVAILCVVFNVAHDQGHGQIKEYCGNSPGDQGQAVVREFVEEPGVFFSDCAHDDFRQLAQKYHGHRNEIGIDQIGRHANGGVGVAGGGIDSLEREEMS